MCKKKEASSILLGFKLKTKGESKRYDIASTPCQAGEVGPWDGCLLGNVRDERRAVGL